MERDFAFRYTDEVYASKDEVKRFLSISNIDAIWDRIISYRNFFRYNLDLISVEQRSFSIVLPLSLQNRISKLERKIVKLLIKYSQLSTDDSDKIINNCLFNIARSYAKNNSLSIDDDLLKDLLSGKIYEIPQAYLTLNNYIMTIKYYLNKTASSYDANVLTGFYGKILRKEINPNDFDSYARIIDHNNPLDHVDFGRHYNSAPLDKLEVFLNDLYIFNSRSSLSSIVKGVVSYFYLMYIKPFDYFNEETALLSLKYVVSHEDLDVLPFLLNLEEKLLNFEEEHLKDKFLLSELNLDLTYFLTYIFDLIESCFYELEDMLNDLQINNIKQEFKQSDEINISARNSSYNQEVINNNSPIIFERKVSLPSLPTGLDARDVDLIADNLKELYPTLKGGQAKFYASHCTIGKYYTIAQYKKEIGVAYETARTSMDNLVTLGFYKKEQIKNKFVYTPVVRER